jgi:hypothetical protein
MLIAVLNKSSMVSNADVDLMCKAIQIQIDLHVAPAYKMLSGTVKFYSDQTHVPGYAWIVNIIDNDAQVAGALGYHEETNDKVVAYIMCQPILSNGGTVLSFNPNNPQQYSVSGTLSHEVLEMIGNRFANCYYDNGSVSIAAELCDPVEQIGYPIMVNGLNVAVSDFVFPSYFNPNATLAINAPFNYLNTLKAPFTMLPGGYLIQRTGGPGSEQQVFGEEMPEWRKNIKAHVFARINRNK